MAIEPHDVPVNANEFNIYVDDFIEGNEKYSSSVYPDSVHVPTIGYGYALLVKINGQWQRPSYLQTDFEGIRIDITQYYGTLDAIAADLNKGDVNDADRLTNILNIANGSVPPLALTSPDQGPQLLTDSVSRQNNLIPAAVRNALQIGTGYTQEGAAIEDMAGRNRVRVDLFADGR